MLRAPVDAYRALNSQRHSRDDRGAGTDTTVLSGGLAEPWRHRSGPEGALTAELDAWLTDVPSVAGLRSFSRPRPFDMPEEEYERRIGSQQRSMAGAAIYRLYEHFGGRPNGVALEIGAGSGAATVGFVAAAKSMRIVLTDPSVPFLHILREKLRREGVAPEELVFGTLIGEDLSRFPSNALDLVFVQAAIHHVLDYRRFILETARILKPGGMLIFQEPFSEGYLMMVLVVEFMLRMDGTTFTLSADDRRKIIGMREAMLMQSNRCLEKARHEDKHCFYTDEIMTVCWNEFDSVHFLRNQSFDSIADLQAIGEVVALHSTRSSITDYLRSFMVHHHLVSDDGARKYDAYVAPALRPVDALYRQGDGPAMFAVVVCVKGA